MKLIIMRHTDAAWGRSGGDHARSLSEAGQNDARNLGQWLRDQGHLPDVALVSDARRTRETFDLLGITCGVSFHHTLYLASLKQLREAIAAQTNVGCILLLAHNPGIAELAEVYASLSHPQFSIFPSGSTLVWDTVSGRVLDFVTPDELPTTTRH